MSRLLKVTGFDGNQITATDPTNVNNTFRQKRNIAQKFASDGSPLTNVRNEFSLNAIASLPAIVAGARAPSETLSVKIIISGSTANKTALGHYVDDAFANVKSAIAADALEGFVLQPTDTENSFIFDSHVV